MLWVLRIALYVQMLLGVGRFLGMVANQRVWETHISLGVLIALLGLVTLRPVPGVPQDGVRTAARIAPLVPLFLGLGLMTDVLTGVALTVLHMLTGVATVGLVEAAVARQRRAQAPKKP